MFCLCQMPMAADELCVNNEQETCERSLAVLAPIKRKGLANNGALYTISVIYSRKEVCCASLGKAETGSHFVIV